MRFVLFAVILLGCLNFSVAAQPRAKEQQSAVAANEVRSNAATVSALSLKIAPSVEAKAAASLVLQEAFDARLLDRGQRALASICDGCGLQHARPLARRGQTTSPVLSSRLPDAETIYTPGRNFDPAQARID
jgi:hypothetical protein